MNYTKQRDKKVVDCDVILSLTTVTRSSSGYGWIVWSVMLLWNWCVRTKLHCVKLVPNKMIPDGIITCIKSIRK